MRTEESIGHRAKRQRSEVRSRRSEGRGQRRDVGGWRSGASAGSGLEVGGKGQETEDRRSSKGKAYKS